MEDRTERLFESYFANELSAEQAQELRDILAKDPEAEAEFAWQQRIASHTKSLSLAGSIENHAWREATKPPFRTVSIWRQAMAAAAAIAVLVVAYTIIKDAGTKAPTQQELIAANFRYYPNKLPFKSLGGGGDSSSQVPQSVIAAFQIYDDSTQYHAAAQALAKIVSENPDKIEYRFYQGVALLGDQQYLAAATALQPVADTVGTYQVPALYYLGLAHLGAGDQGQAKKYLQAYRDSEEGITFRKQTQNLLNALK
jgi:tetratricopeptide (TPR) repeat protein